MPFLKECIRIRCTAGMMGRNDWHQILFCLLSVLRLKCQIFVSNCTGSG